MGIALNSLSHSWSIHVSQQTKLIFKSAHNRKIILDSNVFFRIWFFLPWDIRIRNVKHATTPRHKIYGERLLKQDTQVDNILCQIWLCALAKYSELQLPDKKGEHDSPLQTVTQNLKKYPRTRRKFKNSSGLGGVYLEISQVKESHCRVL